jgi:hypothetical protein
MALRKDHGLPIVHPSDHPDCVRSEGADHDAIVDGVGAQHAVRVRVSPRDDQLDFVLD